MAADRGEVTLVGLLDLSAVFDHDILLDSQRVAFGIQGTALSWIESFVRGRTQRVNFAGGHSSSLPVTYGVLQDSVLRPVLFLFNTADVITIARRHDIVDQSYADDTSYTYIPKPRCVLSAFSDWYPASTNQQVDVIKPIEAEVGQNRFYFARNASASYEDKLQINQNKWLNIPISNQVTCLDVLVDIQSGHLP